MALDYGEKRIGIALSDPLRMFSKPLVVLPNEGILAVAELLQPLIGLHQVSLLVLGMPYAIDGSKTPKTLETLEFMKQLKLALQVPIISFDERYSTCDAQAELKKMGYSWQEARKVVDAMAACMFLQTFLDSNTEEATSHSSDDPDPSLLRRL